ncbi:MAG: ABC transporter permease subunit [Bacteroidales bacterium]|nr:ABC transporter permease subunit [Bacteroidales bacterium]
MNIFVSFLKKNQFFLFFISILLLSTFLLNGCKNDQKTHIPKSLNELGNSKVAVVLGTIQDIYMTEQYPDCEMIRLNSLPECLAAVEKGIADYTVLDSIAILGAGIEKRGMQVDFCLNDYTSIASAFRFEDDNLCQQYNEFLAEIHQNGTVNEMKERWLSDNALNTSMPPIDRSTSGTPILVGTINFNFPFSFIKDGQLAGYEMEMMYRFGTYIGRPVEISAYEFSSILMALNSGKIDIVTCFLCQTEERAKTVLFSDPYYQCQSICVGRSANSNAYSDNNFWDETKEVFKNDLLVEKRWKLLLDGLWETVFISFFSIIIGTILGCLICALRMSRRKLWRGITIGYTKIMHGMPILVFLMIMFYIVFAPTQVTATWVAIIAFAMNFGAFVSEMFLSGIQSVDHGQVEAGRALGFSKRSTFVNFVLPQALHRIFPVYKGEAISLIKNTSIVGYIAIQDITNASDIIRSRTFDAFFPLIIITIIYFILAWILGAVLDYINKKTTHA